MIIRTRNRTGYLTSLVRTNRRRIRSAPEYKVTLVDVSTQEQIVMEDVQEHEIRLVSSNLMGRGETARLQKGNVIPLTVLKGPVKA